MDRVYPVEQAGELLGALAVRKPASDPVTPADEKLIADLAAQAGLVLRNVRLSEELKARLDELKAAQKRLVSAQDEEPAPAGAQHPRRRAATARRARGQAQARRQPDRARYHQGARAPRADPARDARGARGPARPGARDLSAAARRQGPARRARGAGPQERAAGHAPGGRRRSLPAGGRGGRVLLVPRGAAERGEVRRGVRDRHHAGRSRATRISFTVADDGRGFDPSAARTGTGLQGIADRLGALDGRVTVTSCARTRDHARGLACPRSRWRRCPRERAAEASDEEAKGLRRVERWMVGLAMGVIAFVWRRP